VTEHISLADHSSPSSDEVKNAWSYTSTHPHVFTESYLIKHRDNFTIHNLYFPSFTVEVCWVVRPWNVVVGYQRFGGPYCLQLHSLHPEDGGSMGIRKFGTVPQHYTASQPTRPRHGTSPWKPLTTLLFTASFLQWILEHHELSRKKIYVLAANMFVETVQTAVFIHFKFTPTSVVKSSRFSPTQSRVIKSPWTLQCRVWSEWLKQQHWQDLPPGNIVNVTPWTTSGELTATENGLPARSSVRVLSPSTLSPCTLSPSELLFHSTVSSKSVSIHMNYWEVYLLYNEAAMYCLGPIWGVNRE
jgi:hypothetical protein